MRTDNKHIDQSSELSALQDEISVLKDMMSVMQEIIIKQDKQISDIHKALFNTSKKSNEILKSEKKTLLKAKILAKTTIK